MGRKTPPFSEYPAWTEARFKQFIRSALRKAWSKFPPKHLKIQKNRKAVKGKKHKYEIQCERCKQWFPQKDIDVDHITPAGSSEDWNVFINNLFVGEDKLQLLCKHKCHPEKTKEDRERAKEGN